MGKKSSTQSTILDASLAHLLSSDGILRPHPASAPLGLALLCQLRLGNPVIPGLGLSSGAIGGSANLGFPVGVASGSLIAGELAEAPEGKTRRQGNIV